MKTTVKTHKHFRQFLEKDSVRFIMHTLLLTLAYFSAELVVALFLHTKTPLAYAFGLLWSLLLASAAMLLPRKAGRIFFGITFFAFAVYSLAQAAHFDMFRKLMWFSAVLYAGEGAVFWADVLRSFPLLWWPCVIGLLTIGVLLLRYFPKRPRKLAFSLSSGSIAIVCVIIMAILPSFFIFTGNDEETPNSRETAYTTMYDAEAVYSFTGFYHLTFRDFWCNVVYPHTASYQATLPDQTAKVDRYFSNRKEPSPNSMTGIYEGKNVVYVLMESMDDWMITQEDTPTLYKLMGESIRFTNFYSPGFGSSRTLNTEFCINTGIYLPTSASYLFDYVDDKFNQSLASQAVQNGYSAEVFHYNDPDFYSRGILEPAMGYNKYNSYGAYTDDKNALFDDCTLFEIPALTDLFFREGQTFNTIITRSAHLSYDYNEVLTKYALSKYPEYKGKYGSEEEDCARVKARMVDDMFTMLMDELTRRGLLKNTVIVAVTDHYTYGYNDLEEIFALSNVDHELLLEKTPCFIWSADKPSMEVDKPLCSADLVPTMLNLLGIDSPYTYLGQDAFDPDYKGYVYFPDGSWIEDGVIAFKNSGTAGYDILANENGLEITDEYLLEMQKKVENFILTNNLLLTSNYYNTVR